MTPGLDYGCDVKKGLYDHERELFKWHLADDAILDGVPACSGVDPG